MNHGKSFNPVLVATLITAILSNGYGRSAQQKQEETLTLKSELVQFDVLVTDKQGHPVTGLTKDDFVLSDSGKPRDIGFFSSVDVATGSQDGSAVNPAMAPAGTSATRTIFIILDAYHIGLTDYPYLNKALSRLIDEDLLPGDQVSIVSTDGRLPGFQQATRNKKILSLAIQALVAPSAQTALAAQLANDKGRQLQLALDTLQTLVSVAKAASAIPGRKLAFLISESLPSKPLDPNVRLYNLFSELEEVISESRKGGLTFYAMDPRGLVGPRTKVDVSGDSAVAATAVDPVAGLRSQLLEQESLTDFAARTGGYAILNNNDLHAGLQKVMYQNSSYYVLAYYPSDLPDKQQFRNVKVQVKDRPDLNVYSRAGYLWTGTTQGDQKLAELPKQKRVTNALAAIVPIRDLIVAIPQAAVVEDKKTGQPVAEMEISIDPNSWPFKVDGADHLAAFEVDGFAYDVNNKLVDSFSENYNLRIKPEKFASAMKIGMNIPGRIKLKKHGLYTLRVVVIDKDTNRVGSATEWVQAQ